MVHEVNYVDGEREGYSCKLIIEHRIFYVKLFQSPEQSEKYYVGDQDGALKEISKNEFGFWLETLADSETEIEDVKKKVHLGKKYPP